MCKLSTTSTNTNKPQHYRRSIRYLYKAFRWSIIPDIASRHLLYITVQNKLMIILFKNNVSKCDLTYCSYDVWPLQCWLRWLIWSQVQYWEDSEASLLTVDDQDRSAHLSSVLTVVVSSDKVTIAKSWITYMSEWHVCLLSVRLLDLCIV